VPKYNVEVVDTMRYSLDIEAEDLDDLQDQVQSWMDVQRWSQGAESVDGCVNWEHDPDQWVTEASVTRVDNEDADIILEL